MNFNTHFLDVRDELLSWLSNRVKSNCFRLDCTQNILDTAFPSDEILFSSVSGAFWETKYSEINVPKSSVILITPQSGSALLECNHHMYLLERGQTAVLAGPLKLKIAISVEPFEFFITRLGNGTLKNLIRSLLVNLLPGDFRMIRNKEIGCLSNAGEECSYVSDRLLLADSTLIHLLAMRTPDVTPRDSFRPKMVENFSHYKSLALTVWANPELNWSLTEAARKIGYSTFYFSRTFRAECQMGFREFILECKVRNTSYLLLEERLTVEMSRIQSGFHPRISLTSAIKHSTGFSQKCLIQFRDFAVKV